MSGSADNTARFTALVLAGQRVTGDPLADAMGVSRKCLIPILGQTLLERAVAALAESPSVGAIRVMTDTPELCGALPVVAALRGEGRLEFLTCADSPCASVRAGLRNESIKPPLLVTTADHALLSVDVVEAFCAGARSSDADAAAAVAMLERVQAAYPKSHRTSWGFRDGRYVSCNLFALLTPESVRAVEVWQGVEDDRKRPWRIVRRFGPWQLLLYALGRLTLKAGLARLSRVAGCRTGVVLLTAPEAAVDVDTREDVDLAAEILRQRKVAASGAAPGASSAGQSETRA